MLGVAVLAMLMEIRDLHHRVGWVGGELHKGTMVPCESLLTRVA